MKQILIYSFIFSLVWVSTLQGQTVSRQYLKNWSDPEIEERIHTGIEKNRKGWADITFVDDKGNPVEWSGQIQVRQTSHDFLFGANIFMLNGYEEEWENKQYEQIFKDLLNFATVPFYWKTLEPGKGNIRFSENSRHIYRRPAPDMVVEFCKKNNITMKGHPLFWDNAQWNIPTWWPSEKDSLEFLIRRHVQKIANRYRNDILHWDVVNEVNARHVDVPVPDQFPSMVFEVAEKYFGYDNQFTYNFTTNVWRDYKEEYGLEYLLAENLLLKGAKVDAIGFQCHMWGHGQWKSILEGKHMTPKHMLKFLDLFAQFDLPILITEVTFPTLPEGETGEKNQARITRDWYRLWFSHPHVKGITWWNVSDGTAAGSEDQWKGGFLRKDMSPKPSYQVLDDLINHEWKTQITQEVENQFNYKFKGFYGTYEVSLLQHGEEIMSQTIQLDEDRENEFQFDLAE